MPGWYWAGERAIEIASGTAVWRHGGLPVVPIRWVLIRDPANRYPPRALLCTDFDRTPDQIVEWFVRRWSVEVTFQEVRAHVTTRFFRGRHRSATGSGLGLAIAEMASHRSGLSLRLRNRTDRPGLEAEILPG